MDLRPGEGFVEAARRIARNEECAIYEEIRDGIEQRRALLPPVPDTFRRRLEELLAEAKIGAVLALPNPVTVYVRERRGVVECVRRGSRCVECGCDYDDRTRGCRACRSRHGVRRWQERRRLAEAA